MKEETNFLTATSTECQKIATNFEKLPTASKITNAKESNFMFGFIYFHRQKLLQIFKNPLSTS